MRRAFALVFATTLLVGSAALAQEYRRDMPPPQDRFQERSDRDVHVWARGERVPAELRDRDHTVWDWRAHHLRRPPDGYAWVRDRDRFMLVSKRNGRIAELAEAR